VSTGGGWEPAWANSGRELFYRDNQDNLLAVQVRQDASSWDEQVTLFSAANYMSATYPMYAVSPDDQRFLMLPLESIDYDLVLVQNFLQEIGAGEPN
jgi:hypothetical protein